jgi:zinc/manganese transport system substrate-binding protein
MSSHRIRSLLTAASALTVLGLAVTACSSSNQGAPVTVQTSVNPQAPETSANQPTPAETIKVVASTSVWGSVLSAVGGDKVQVTSIIHDPGEDASSYQSTVQDGLAAQSAKILLGNGGGYDDFFTTLADQAPGAKKLVAYDIAATGDPNEYVWYALPGVEKVADQVAMQLGEVQPTSKQVFLDNAAAFKTKVDELVQKVTQLGVGHPGTKVVATEPIAHYLLATAKITDATPAAYSAALEEDTEVPAAAVDQVRQLIDGKQVKAVVNNTQTTTPATDQIIANAKTAGVAVVAVTETLPAGATDYVNWMSTEVDALAGAVNS